jgi:N-terminal domain of anti-restriction factor ArdC/IrrE N-terminal-like domain
MVTTTAQRTRPDQVAELQEQITAGVEALVTGEDWTRWLKMAQRFHHYSFGNLMLILTQKPDATRCAGFNTWRSMGRFPHKGTGIAILAPVTYRPRKDAPDDADDPKRNGRPRGFKKVHVFDVADTEGEPLPDVSPTLLQGEGPKGVWDALVEVAGDQGYTVDVDDLGPYNGLTTPDEHRITVHVGRDQAQRVKTLAHELGHVLCGHVEDLAVYREHRGRMEVEAESVAFIVSGSVGLDSSGYSFGYVAEWSQGDPGVVRAAAEAASKAARTILAGLPA